jgi:hypothetical protein
MAEIVAHWFNRVYGMGRRDVYILRVPTGWQVRGREGNVNHGREVLHYFDDEADAYRMAQAMRDDVPPQLCNWALMPKPPLNPR